MLTCFRRLIFLGLFLVSPLGLASSDSLKVGVLNLVDIMQSSSEAVQLRDKIEKEFSVRQQEIIALQKATQGDFESFKRDEAVMSENDKKALTDKINAAQQELQKMQYEFQQQFSQREQEETQMFLMGLKQAVEQLANEESYDLIVRSDFVAYQRDSYDVTERALAVYRANKAEAAN